MMKNGVRSFVIKLQCVARMHTSLRALVLVAFYCVLALSKFNGTFSSVSPGYQHGAG